MKSFELSIFVESNKKVETSDRDEWKFIGLNLPAPVGVGPKIHNEVELYEHNERKKDNIVENLWILEIRKAIVSMSKLRCFPLYFKDFWKAC